METLAKTFVPLWLCERKRIEQEDREGREVVAAKKHKRRNNELEILCFLCLFAAKILLRCGLTPRQGLFVQTIGVYEYGVKLFLNRHAGSGFGIA